MKRKFRGEFRSGCPISSSLDLVGDTWSLVILRDMINGKKRFGEFMESPEGITTNVLTDRLTQMETAGLIERRPYREKPRRFEYVLTEKGRDLHPVLQAYCRWANKHIPDTWVPPPAFMRKLR